MYAFDETEWRRVIYEVDKDDAWLVKRRITCELIIPDHVRPTNSSGEKQLTKATTRRRSAQPSPPRQRRPHGRGG
eukprot:6212677-Pleurochrysis_carterae.AAC.6